MVSLNKAVIFISILIQLLSIGDSICQSGYVKIVNVNNSPSFNIDDIIYKNDYLYISGNAYDPDVKLWGSVIAKLDTIGNLIWSSIIFDSLYVSDLVANSPNRLSFGVNNNILSSANIFQLNKTEIIVADSLGNEIFQRKFETNDFIIFPVDIRQVESDIYFFGIAQRYNYQFDVIIIKVNTLGKIIWTKYFGKSTLDEALGDVLVNSNNTFTVTACAAKDGWYNEYEVTGTNKPWIFTIDTSGAIVSQWFGDDNDARTNGRGPLYRAANGDYIIASYDIKGYPGTFDQVRSSPTVTRLDSNFNLVWKLNLTSFNNYWDKIMDMAYDSSRDEFIVAGNQRVYYTPDSSASYAWVEKISGSGEIVWNRFDTALYLGYGKVAHFTSGLAIAPSGSMYVAGWVRSQEFNNQGWIMKVTPDGCTDTLCTITSIQDQLVKNQKQINIRPNPVYDELHISIPAEYSGAIIEILNIQGQLVFQTPLKTADNVIEADFPTGLYFYTIRKQNQLIGSGKFIRM